MSLFINPKFNQRFYGTFLILENYAVLSLIEVCELFSHHRSRITKRVQLDLESRKISPRCESMMRFEILKPKPLPWPGSLVVKNGAMIRLTISMGTPFPLSVTDISVQWFCSSASTRTHFSCEFIAASKTLFQAQGFAKVLVFLPFDRLRRGCRGQIHLTKSSARLRKSGCPVQTALWTCGFQVFDSQLKVWKRRENCSMNIVFPGFRAPGARGIRTLREQFVETTESLL